MARNKTTAVTAIYVAVLMTASAAFSFEPSNSVRYLSRSEAESTWGGQGVGTSSCTGNKPTSLNSCNVASCCSALQQQQSSIAGNGNSSFVVTACSETNSSCGTFSAYDSTGNCLGLQPVPPSSE